MKIELNSIGSIRTPYKDWAPHQPPEREAEQGAFRLELDEQHRAGLDGLERFSHLIVVSYLDRSDKECDYRVKPPWAKGHEVGLWATRSPNRPNPVGLSIVRILRIEDGVIFTSPLDLFDETPLLDLKPYVGTLDSRDDANSGWIEDFDDHGHMMQHLRGIPHDHSHGHDHDHGHDHSHSHDHDHGDGHDHH